MPLLQLTLNAPAGASTTNPVFAVSWGHNFVEQPITLRQVCIVSNEPVNPGDTLPVLDTSETSHGLLWIDFQTSTYMSTRQVNGAGVSDSSSLPIPCDHSTERALTQVYTGMHQTVNIHDMKADDRIEVRVLGSTGSQSNYTTWGTDRDAIRCIQCVFSYEEITGVN